MGEDFLMKKKLNLIQFSQKLIKIFSDYSINLDEYFKNEKNRNEHTELYEYYKKLITDIAKLKEIN